MGGVIKDSWLWPDSDDSGWNNVTTFGTIDPVNGEKLYRRDYSDGTLLTECGSERNEAVTNEVGLIYQIDVMTIEAALDETFFSFGIQQNLGFDFAVPGANVNFNTNVDTPTGLNVQVFGPSGNRRVPLQTDRFYTLKIRISAADTIDFYVDGNEYSNEFILQSTQSGVESGNGYGGMYDRGSPTNGIFKVRNYYVVTDLGFRPPPTGQADETTYDWNLKEKY
jgi:hypothetical protein